MIKKTKLNGEIMKRIFSFAATLSFLMTFSICFSWAGTITIELPRTGQTKCYSAYGNEVSCSGTGQDGDIQAGAAWPAQRFSVSGNCVTDSLTGLVWPKDGNISIISLNWLEAFEHITKINKTGEICGKKDWRLPNINEIESLLNFSVTNNEAWLNMEGFMNVKADVYWSSTTYSLNTNYAWSLNVWDGSILTTDKADYRYVWPVRGGQTGSVDTNFAANIWKTGQTESYSDGDDGKNQKGVTWPNPRFTNNGNGTVTDNLTGLAWLRDANCFTSQVWQQALDRVSEFNINPRSFSCSGYTASFNDWRLPNRKELMSLIDRSSYDNALPYYPVTEGYQPFINTKYMIFWSSTTQQNKTEHAWYISLSNGEAMSETKLSHNNIWPVRFGAASGNNCAGTISSSMYLHLPVIVYDNTKLNATFQYTPASDGYIWFKLTKSENITDSALYNSCQASTFSSDNILRIPELSFYGKSYIVDLLYIPGSDGSILFKVISAALKL